MTTTPTTEAAEAIKQKRIVGEELAVLVRTLSAEGKTEREIAEAAGYFTVNATSGEKQAKFLPFRSALLKSSGFGLRSKSESVAEDGFCRVGKSGQLVIGSRFIRNFARDTEGLRFKVDVTKTGIIVTLAPESTEPAAEPAVPTFTTPEFANAA